MRRTRKRRETSSLVVLLTALVGAGPVAAQDRPPVSLEEPLPTDPAVTVGTLENGLRYYIRTNQRPEDRAELRLVVNVGSVLENDDQRGLAHFLEHMAFNGTANFEKQEIVDYLESIGMEFGPEVNAYTSFDETVYMLEVPTDDPEILEFLKCVRILKPHVDLDPPPALRVLRNRPTGGSDSLPPLRTPLDRRSHRRCRQ